MAHGSWGYSCSSGLLIGDVICLGSSVIFHKKRGKETVACENG